MSLFGTSLPKDISQIQTPMDFTCGATLTPQEALSRPRLRFGVRRAMDEKKQKNTTGWWMDWGSLSISVRLSEELVCFLYFYFFSWAACTRDEFSGSADGKRRLNTLFRKRLFFFSIWPLQPMKELSWSLSFKAVCPNRKIKKPKKWETATFGSAKFALSSSIDGIWQSLSSRAKNRCEKNHIFFFFFNTPCTQPEGVTYISNICIKL